MKEERTHFSRDSDFPTPLSGSEQLERRLFIRVIITTGFSVKKRAIICKSASCYVYYAHSANDIFKHKSRSLLPACITHCSILHGASLHFPPINVHYFVPALVLMATGKAEKRILGTFGCNNLFSWPPKPKTPNMRVPIWIQTKNNKHGIWNVSLTLESEESGGFRDKTTQRRRRKQTR